MNIPYPYNSCAYEVGKLLLPLFKRMLVLDKRINISSELATYKNYKVFARILNKHIFEQRELNLPETEVSD